MEGEKEVLCGSGRVEGEFRVDVERSVWYGWGSVDGWWTLEGIAAYKIAEGGEVFKEEG